MLRQKIKDAIIKEFNLVDVDDNANIRLLAEDSLGRIELLFAVETAIGKSLTDEDILKIETVDDLVKVFENKINS
jgi:acyl carrier protein